MNIQFFCPRWGMAHLPWEPFARLVKDTGFDGVETDIPEEPAGREEMLQALAKYDLRLIAQHWQTVDPAFETHAAVYAKRLEYMAAVNPLFINSQTGRDFFSPAQNETLLTIAAQTTVATGIPVYHETHRGKFSFAAHVTADFLHRVPGLELTLDISHWYAVAETFLDDQQQAVRDAIERTRHIHARIGHTQGPQVPDPRSPDAREALKAHLACWDKVVEARLQTGHPLLTFTAEFGPSPYMTLSPATGKPLADQWELNVFMMQMLKERYQPYTGS
ncbi:MAG: sugar phosphate isomerase/epimerase [Chitinophagaceae bacterium]|nr:sugar phosphate isomerase/epimerase [Chitinophagaceae bacterium]